MRMMREPLAGFVQEMTARAVAEGLADQDTIDGRVTEIGYGRPIADLDTRILLKLMERVWNPVFWDKPGKLGRAYAGELLFFCNARAHQQDESTFDAERLVDTATRFLNKCTIDLPGDLRALRRVTRRHSEPETEPGGNTEEQDATRVEYLIRDRTSALEKRLADVSAAVIEGNETLAALLQRVGRKLSEPERSEVRREACSDRQAGAIYAVLMRLGVSTADDDAIRDALDDPEFDGSLIKTWCRKRYTKDEADKKIRALNRRIESRNR